MKGLRSASGFIRRELGRRLQLRHVPELIFKATDSIEYSANISRMLHDLEAEGKMAKEPAPSGEECREDAGPKGANG